MDTFLGILYIIMIYGISFGLMLLGLRIIYKQIKKK